MTSRVHRFEHVRQLADDLEPVVQQFEREPSRWLPGPLHMTGVQRVRRTTPRPGLGLRYRYILEPEWVRDPTASRYAELLPASSGNPTIIGEITLAAVRPSGTELRFTGEWHPPRSLAARPFSRLVARTLLSSFTDTLAGNLTAVSPDGAGGSEDPLPGQASLRESRRR